MRFSYQICKHNTEEDGVVYKPNGFVITDLWYGAWHRSKVPICNKEGTRRTGNYWLLLSTVDKEHAILLS